MTFGSFSRRRRFTSAADDGRQAVPVPCGA
jgi:hypothetical protein